MHGSLGQAALKRGGDSTGHAQASAAVTRRLSKEDGSPLAGLLQVISLAEGPASGWGRGGVEVALLRIKQKLRLPAAPTFSPASAQGTCLKRYQVISLLRAAPLLNHLIEEDAEAQG